MMGRLSNLAETPRQSFRFSFPHTETLVEFSGTQLLADGEVVHCAEAETFGSGRIVGVCKCDVAAVVKVYQGFSPGDLEYVTTITTAADATTGAGSAFSIEVAASLVKITVSVPANSGTLQLAAYLRSI
jgi:hypothetical protein